MRIMIDTNVLISAVLFSDSIPSKVVEKVIDKHKLILCSQIVDEIHDIFSRKFKNKLLNLEKFLSKLSFELVYTPMKIEVDKYP